jgi:hypothetical protein
MTVTPAQVSTTGPADSLEVRWIIPGPLGAGMREWFARFPAAAEEREDAYLAWPRLEGLSVKLRDRALEVKSYAGSAGILALPRRGRGRLERWRKWSFPCAALTPAGAMPPGWITVRKARSSSWFPLPAGQAPGQPAAGTGCSAELTEAAATGRRWWTVGLEATGSAGLLLDAVQHAVSRLFESPLPAGTELGLDNSLSYAQWLHRQAAPEPPRP